MQTHIVPVGFDCDRRYISMEGNSVVATSSEDSIETGRTPHDNKLK